MRREPAQPSQPVRVLVIAASLDILGGEAIQAADLVEHLRAERGVEVTFIAINPRLPGLLRRLQSIKYVRTVVTSALYTARLLASVPRQDIVHVFSAAHLSFLISPTPAIVIAKVFRKAVVLHYHSGEADLHLRRWQRTAAPIMRRVDTIVVPSQYLVTAFARHGLNARLIPNTIDPERFPFRERQPLRPVFLCTRQLLPMYNVDCVLRAFGVVQQRVGEARLIVVGDGSSRQRLERQARQLQLRRAEFIGSVPPARMGEVYSAADVFLNGSESDNSPVSILEAFAAGLPVVSTAVGGIPELVRPGETGMLVARDDHAEMAACALRLLDDPGLPSKLARHAHEESRRYVWPAVRDEWLTLYGQLAASTDSVQPQ